MRARFGRRLIRDERGAAIVEFAISSVLFLTVVFGTMEFSRMALAYSMVSSGAREGARYASVRGANSGRPATVAEIQTYIAGRSAGIVNATDVTVTWPVNNKRGSLVQVQVQRPFTVGVALLPSGTINLQSTTEMTIVR